MSNQNQSVKLITKLFRRSGLSENKKKNNKSKKKIKRQSLGGVFHVTDELYQQQQITIGGLKSITENPSSKLMDGSSHSVSTMDTTGHCSEVSETFSTGESNKNWLSSGSPSHHDGAPLLVRSAISQRNLMMTAEAPIDLSDEEVMGRVMLRARRTLPKSNNYLASNHVMINNERVKRTRVPLKRNPKLDEIAQDHAKAMGSSKQGLYHPNLENLPTMSCTRLGSNVGCGGEISDIHTTFTSNKSDLNNIIDRRFVYMGVGTAKGSDGKMYLCQIFTDDANNMQQQPSSRTIGQ